MSHTHNYHQVGAVHHGSGAISGIIQNVNSTVENIKQGIGSSANIEENNKEQLTRLFDQLADSLKQVPSEHAEDVEAVTVTAQELMQKADQEKPNRAMVRVSAKGLVEAATAVATVTPKVLSVAQEIAKFFGFQVGPV